MDGQMNEQKNTRHTREWKDWHTDLWMNGQIQCDNQTNGQTDVEQVDKQRKASTSVRNTNKKTDKLRD